MYRSNAAWHWQGNQEAITKQKKPALADEYMRFAAPMWNANSPPN